MNDTLRIQNQTYLILLINPKYDLPTRVVKVSGEGGFPTTTTTTTSVGARLNGGALGGTNEPNRTEPTRAMSTAAARALAAVVDAERAGACARRTRVVEASSPVSAIQWILI